MPHIQSADTARKASALEKLLASNGSHDEIEDVLQSLDNTIMTVELLRDTKIGIIVNKVKKQTPPDSKVAHHAKTLILQWKKVAEESKEEAKNDVLASSSKEGVPQSSSSSYDTTNDSSADDENNIHYEQLPKARKQVMDIFAEHLALNTTLSIAKFLAFNIEAALQNILGRDNKAYIAKFRSLSFNLKRNEQLRKDIIDGSCPPDVFVNLTAAQLATEELTKERASVMKDSTMARRSDYYQEMRAEIQKSLGINPDSGGEFRCKKCKQNKTTHYSMQTRSSDEPMTVFVCCLTCGNRWRC